MMLLDKIPQVGDEVEFNNVSAKVLSVDGKRADKIKITLKEKENDVQ